MEQSPISSTHVPQRTHHEKMSAAATFSSAPTTTRAQEAVGSEGNAACKATANSSGSAAPSVLAVRAATDKRPEAASHGPAVAVPDSVSALWHEFLDVRMAMQFEEGRRKALHDTLLLIHNSAW